MHMQRLNVRPGAGGGAVHPQAPMGVGANPQQRVIPPVAQQQTALQKLQEEKEQLRKRQEELNRQVNLEQVHFVCTRSIMYVMHSNNSSLDRRLSAVTG